jgi:hypothetical protein
MGFEHVLVFGRQIRLKPFPQRQSATTSRAGGMRMAPGRGRGHALLLVADLSLMKLHLFRQDLQDYQDFFGLVLLYPVHPVDPVRYGKFMPLSFFFDQTGHFAGQRRRSFGDSYHIWCEK